MSSINLDLDFQDYASSSSGARTIPQQRSDVQVKIPPFTDNDKRQNINQGTKPSVLNVLQNLQTGQASSSSGGLTDEALQQLIWISNRQKARQQQQQQQRPGGGGWGLGYLAQYFDVTTTDVVQRILWSAVPIRKQGIDVNDLNDAELTESLNRSLGDSEASLNEMNSRVYDQINTGKQKRYSYMERFIQSRPDFYGPFWISASLIFAVAIFSNLVSFLQFRSKLYQDDQMSPNNSLSSANIGVNQMDKTTEEWHYSMYELNMATSVVMYHVTLLPTFLWFLFWFRGCTNYYTLSETICAYGYSLSIFIPLSALLMIQATFFRYIVLTLASTLSGLALVLSFLPVIQSDPNKKGTHFTLIIVAASQFGLAYVLHRIMLQ